MNDIVAQARKAGAKLYRSESGRWVCLDMPNTPLWTLSFDTIRNAAKAFLLHHEYKHHTPAGSGARV